MELKVCYSNPNPSGSPVVILTDVGTWKTDHAELIIIKESGSRIIFAARQWIWVEETGGEREGKAQETGSIRSGENGSRHRRADHHNPTGDSGRRLSDVSDLSIPDALSVERAKAASVEFAIDNRTVPWSESHMRKLLEYEDAVAAEYGPDAVLKLPWNQIPRGEDAKRRM